MTKNIWSKLSVYVDCRLHTRMKILLVLLKYLLKIFLVIVTS